MGRSGERPPHRAAAGFSLRDARAPPGHAPRAACCPASPYFHIFEGVLMEVPALLGLPPATIVTSTVTPRTMDIVMQLPPSSSDRRPRPAQAARGRLPGRGARPPRGTTSRDGHGPRVRSALDRRAAYPVRIGFPTSSSFTARGPCCGRIERWRRCSATRRPDDLVGRGSARPRGPALARPRGEPNAGARGRRGIRISSRCGCGTRDGDLVFVEVSPTQTVSFGGHPARLVVGRDVGERDGVSSSSS